MQFKRTLPGRSGHLAYGSFSKSDPSLDTSHPLASVVPQQLLRVVPQYRCPLFTLYCYPFAVLKKYQDPEYMLMFKQKQSSNELGHLLSSVVPGIKISPPTCSFPNDLRREKETLPMPLMILTPKHIHKSGFVRSKIKGRLREALKLVIIRGAVQAKSGNGIKFTFAQGLSLDSPDERLTLKGKQKTTTTAQHITPRSYPLEDWIYTFRPTVEVYCAPWLILLKELRQALETVKRTASTTGRENTRRPFHAKKRT